MLLLISRSCNKAECVVMFTLSCLVCHPAACSLAEGSLTQDDDHALAGERMQTQRLRAGWV